MKKYVIITFLFLSSFGLKSQSISLEETRNLYQKSATDKQTCETLYARLNTSENDGNLLLTGYFGAVTANMANHLKEPSQKLKYFNVGRKLIDKAILSDSTNLELRFIRFTIQSNCPKSLRYNGSIDSDKTYLLNHLRDSNNSALKKKMVGYLISSLRLTDDEKNKLKQ